MFFTSDNAGPAHPAVMQAVTDANTGYHPSYGDDALMAEVRSLIRNQFEAPEAVVYLVATGTAANALALSVLAQPWQTIFCTPLSHIQRDECHAPEFFTGGAKLSLVGEADKMTPDQLAAGIEDWVYGDVHVSQRGPVALTQVTEMGHVYTLQELGALTSLAKTYRLPVYMDGARFANAIATLGCSPAEMTWRAGIDALSFGGTKTGCLMSEAVIFLNPDIAEGFPYLRKQAMQLVSKMRFVSAQLEAYLKDDLWLTNARHANAMAQRLAEKAGAIDGVTIKGTVDCNAIFATMPPEATEMLLEKYYFYIWDEHDHTVRWMTSWATTEEMVDEFVADIKKAVEAVR